MKILIVNANDIQGGAAIAAHRLHQSLLSIGIDSTMLVANKKSDDSTIVELENKPSKLKFKINRRFGVKRYRKRVHTPFSLARIGCDDIIDKINQINPDIVHLHWIGEGFLKLEDLLQIKYPIVWSMHDNWLFTGGCHIMWSCEKYKNSCGNCPILNSGKENDLSKKTYFRKQNIFSKIDNMTVIGLSNWLNECSKNSSLLKDKSHINLPNPIDTKLFKPCDKTQSREFFNLPQDKKLILFGANSATKDINKGFKELRQALEKLENNTDIELVVFGSDKPETSQNFGFKTRYLGYLDDVVSLITLYSAVNVMVVPSLQENLCNIIIENLACKTPVVAFDIGGNSDIIDHQKNGYLAKPFDTTDLKNGIEWVLNNPNYDELCQQARQKVLTQFDSVIVANQYKNLYQKII